VGGRNLTGFPQHDHGSFHLGGRIVGVETMDKMTNNQIAAKVRQYFKENSSRQ